MPKIEEVAHIEEDHAASHEHHDHDGHDHTHAPANAQQAQAANVGRGEKKIRAAMAKIGLKPSSGYTRVSVVLANRTMISISQPEVYKSGDTYALVGEVKVENMNAPMNPGMVPPPSSTAAPPAAAPKAPAAPTTAAAPAKKAIQADDILGHGGKPAMPTVKSADKNASGEPIDPASEEGLNPDDIEMAMAQSQASRADVVKALRAADGDLVNAIMALTLE